MSEFNFQRGLFISRCLGAFPFNGDLKMSTPRLIHTVFTLCLSVTFSFWAVREDKFISDKFRSWPGSRIIKIFIVNVDNILSIIWLVVKASTLRSVCFNLQQIETCLKENGILWKWQPSVLGLIFKVVSIYSLLLLKAIVLLKNGEISYAWAVSLSYASSVPFLLSVVDQFPFFINLVHSLWEVVPPKQYSKLVIGLHQLLILVCEQVTEAYGLPLTLYFSSAFSFTVSNIYFEVIKGKRRVFLHTVTQFFWVLLILYPGILCIRSTTSIEGMVEKINEFIIQELIHENGRNKFKEELYDFQLTCCRQLEFSACGLFKINNALVCSMITCATTYLVILFQFTNKDYEYKISTTNMTSSD